MTENHEARPLKLDSSLLVHWGESMRRFVAATITRAYLADRVPAVDEPFRARTSHVVFVAHKAA